MQLNTLSMVHEFLRRSVKPGDFCIDATAGKGRDTALLCRLTGDAGRVLAFDIQEAAVAQTKALLAAEGLTAATPIWSATRRRKRWTVWCSTSDGFPAGTRLSLPDRILP